MTPHQVHLVQTSFRAVTADSAAVARAFYARVFELDPALRTLFRGDIAEQGEKLMHMLTLVVNGLERIADLAPSLRTMGKRHGSYGVRRYDFDTIGTALLDTLGQRLGDSFDRDTELAWREAYAVLAREMRFGMAEGDTVPAGLWASERAVMG